MKYREKFWSKEDKEICSIDKPERLQLRLQFRGDLQDDERKDEAKWIAEQLDKSGRLNPADFIPSVEKVLSYLQVENFEIPFIWTYRRDEISNELEVRCCEQSLRWIC
ncbi:MAG: hypothetical protein AAF411_07165 [Myxococcota bacterium]